MRRWNLLVVTVLGVVSCGGRVVVDGFSPDEGTGGAGGTSGSYTSGSYSTGSYTTGTASSNVSSAATGGDTSATCASYCSTVTGNCTGDNAQYQDSAVCQKACTMFVQGKLGDTTGNSLECRAYHAQAAKISPVMHCGHSGLTGGDLDPTASGSGRDGPCGDGVEAFCMLAVATCSGQIGAWPDFAACKTDMVKLPKSTTQFSVTKDMFGNTLNCRVYHLLASIGNPVTHCPHIKIDSAVCK